MNYHFPVPPTEAEINKVEAITVCVGFDDMLDVALTHNHHQVDHYVVVTSHADKKTHQVAKKHGVTLVQTDVFTKNKRKFNKGAALQVGQGHFQWRGWRLGLDADILLSDNWNRMTFNHTHLDTNCIYGMDRVDVVGLEHLARLKSQPQSTHRAFVEARAPISARYVDPLRGYVPIGYFQMWHYLCDKPYPYSVGTAAHDDVLFAEQWTASCRRLLPTGFVYHLVSRPPTLGENWDDNRRQPRLT